MGEQYAGAPLRDLNALKYFVDSEIEEYEKYNIKEVQKWLSRNAAQYQKECETCPE